MRSSKNKSTKISTLVEEDSGHSSASNSPSAQCSPNSTINTSLNKNIEEFNNSIKKLANSTKLLNEIETNDLSQTLSDFDSTSTINSENSCYSTFSSESFLLNNTINDFNDTNKMNQINHNVNIIGADASNSVNIIALNLEKNCIISN